MNDRKRLAVDRGLTWLLENRLHQIILVVLFIASVVLRIAMAPELALSADYGFYESWVEAYRGQGLAEGLGHVIGDYYVPLNIMYAFISRFPWEPWVLLALFSCVFDYLTAGVVFLLARLLSEERGDRNAKRRAAYTAALTWFLPVVFMNSALWKQCDSFYIFFALLAVYLLFKDRFTAAFIMLGVSFSFKMQAVFFLPFFCLFYVLRKKFSILQFLWIPGMYLLAGLPAVLCRRGLRATYGTYFAQMKEGAEEAESYGMVANYPNLYNYGLDDFLSTMALPAALVAFAALLVSVALAAGRRSALNDARLLWLLAWQIWACNMLLPSMHERYDYGAVLLFAVLLPFLPRETIVPAAVLNIGTYITYLRASLGERTGVPITALTAVYTAAFVWTTWVLAHRVIPGRDDHRETTA